MTIDHSISDLGTLMIALSAVLSLTIIADSRIEEAMSDETAMALVVVLFIGEWLVTIGLYEIAKAIRESRKP